MSNRVAVIDSGLCNLDSVGRAIEVCGGEAVVIDNGADLGYVDRIVFPGVGAFAQAMRSLRDRGLDDAMTEQVLDHGIPFLGICLGMQLLATEGQEGGRTKGLGWIDGEVVRLVPGADQEQVRIPHMGWNEVDHNGSSPLFDGIPPGTDFYFVHSYHLVCDRPEQEAARTPYCGGFTSVVQRDLTFGVQFHPEKSQKHGLQLLRNFLAI
jgi:glutamine amidotransferase